MLKSMRKSKNRYFYQMFVSPGDSPGAITLNVVWMESEFDAYKFSRSMYPSIFNSFPDIRTTRAKTPFSRTAAHIFVSPGDAAAIITQYVACMKRQFNACQTPADQLTHRFAEPQRNSTCPPGNVQLLFLTLL